MLRNASRLLAAEAKPAKAPFMPLANVYTHPQQRTKDESTKLMRRYLEYSHGKPEVYEPRYPGENFDTLVEKLRKMTERAPRITAQQVEFLKNLGYPAEFIDYMDNKDYWKGIKDSKGEIQWDKFMAKHGYTGYKQHWIHTQQEAFREKQQYKEFRKTGGKQRVLPLIDWDLLYRKYPDTVRDIRDEIRWEFERNFQQSCEFDDNVFEQYQSDLRKSLDGPIFDELCDQMVVEELRIEYARRAALIQWLKGSGLLTPHQELDFNFKVRDLMVNFMDTNDSGLDTKSVSYSLEEQIPNFDQFQTIQEHHQNEHFGEVEASRSGVKALSAQDNRDIQVRERIETIVSAGKAKTTDAAGGGDKAVDSGPQLQEIISDAEFDVDADPPGVQALWQFFFERAGYDKKYTEIWPEIEKERKQARADRLAAESV